MIKNILSISILVSAILISGVIVGSAMAQTSGQTLQVQEQKMPGDIQFPIAELGNCKSKSDCKVFCDNPSNITVCLKFAEEKKLMSQEELSVAKKFESAGMIGPGGCNGKDSCDNYCSQQEHMEECILFAQKNGLMSAQQLEQSQKVLSAIKKGIKPPACGGPQECDKYCSLAEHMEECINFSREAGLMSKQDQDNADKVLGAIKKGAKLPNCKGQKECDLYCSDPSHMEECASFAIAAGMMKPEEMQRAQQMLDAIKKGVNPPKCKGEQECQAYCSQESHIKECVDFAVAIGQMSEKDAQVALKTGGKGPGGCAGKDACEAFCNNPDNQEVCFNFAKENNLIPAEDLKKMEEGQQKMKESFSQMPSEVLNCLTSTLGADAVEKMKAGSGMPSKAAGEQIGKCFEQNIPKGGMPNQGVESSRPGQFQPAPGAVNSGGQVMPQQAGPGGCKSPEECYAYCKEHLDECRNFGGQGRQIVPETQTGPIPKVQMGPEGSGQVPPGFEAGNFEQKSLNIPQELKQQMPYQGNEGPVPVPTQQSGQMPPQNIQGQYPMMQPGTQPTQQMPPQGQMPYQGGGPIPAPGSYPVPPIEIQQ